MIENTKDEDMFPRDFENEDTTDPIEDKYNDEDEEVKFNF